MIQPDQKIASLAQLPLPHYDQKTIVALYRPAALICRTRHKDWIHEEKAKDTVAKFVRALGSESPDWRILRYKHEVDGELKEIFRCTLTLPLALPVTLNGDSPVAKRASLVAALHALLYLLAKDLITNDGLPKLPPSSLRSSIGSSRSSTSGSSSSSGSGTSENLGRSFTFKGDGEKPAATIPPPLYTTSETRTTPRIARRGSIASSSSALSDTEEQAIPVSTASTARLVDAIATSSLISPAASPARKIAPLPWSRSSQNGTEHSVANAQLSQKLEDTFIASRNQKISSQLESRIALQSERSSQPSPRPGSRSSRRRSSASSTSSTTRSPAEAKPQARPAQPHHANVQSRLDVSGFQSALDSSTLEQENSANNGHVTQEKTWATAFQEADDNEMLLAHLAKQKSMPHQPQPAPPATTQSLGPAKAPGRHEISLELARGFIDFYCRKFRYPKAETTYKSNPNGSSTTWNATMIIGGRSVGNGLGSNMKEATSLAYIDASLWMASCDPNLWMEFLMQESAKQTDEARACLQAKGANKQDFVPPLELKFSDKLDSQLRDVIWQARKSELYRKALMSQAKAEEEVLKVKKQRELAASRETVSENHQKNGYHANSDSYTHEDPMKTDYLRNKSRELQDRQDRYKSDPRMAKMRNTRASLPITNHAEVLLKGIEDNSVLIVMAQTGSGKTTQLPQIILDDFIAKGKGANCNVVCTQPRRLAAISVAQRVAAERGEQTGKSVGYQVRFENSFPEKDGSILFMTSGIFLRRMQVGLEEITNGKSSFLDEVSHVIVDEVHERDIDVDLLLFILRRQLEERRKAGKPEFKVVLMSATIDPSLFCNYFPDPKTGKPAPVVSIPGRTYPVQKYYLDELYSTLQRHPMYHLIRWVFDEKEVKPYMARELQNPLEHSAASRTDDDLKFPAPLVALIIAFVAYRTSKTRDGHILVFLPGLDEIKNVRKVLMNPQQSLFNMDFGRYEMHILHSEVPVAEQQLVFAPAPPGVQRIILSTNIAETSVTIPDVVYVVDAGKCKESRFDPERHLSSLVQAFTGLGNMGQRAGRAGRHRPGEYFSLVSNSRLQCLPQNQTVEMKRLDLSNVVMHVKGLNLPMEVEDVLDECIEPPGHERVMAAVRTLERVGALDPNKNLTSLGKVLLHLPVEAAIGKLCLLGCFFRCLDHVLTIAALLTNRDPFVAPLEKRFEANMAKKRFCPPGYISDTLTSLKAFNEWASLPSFHEQRAFCEENFLAMGGLRTIEKLKTLILQSLDRAGVLSLAAGGDRLQLVRNRDGVPVLPRFLNTNGENMPLLAALISCATAPGFAVRKSSSLLRTPQDTTAMLHSSSIVTIMGKKAFTNKFSKEVFAYTEATKNASKGGARQTNWLKMNSQLRGATLLDPLGLLLLGIHRLEITADGFLCDGWLPITGKVDMLDDLSRLKDVLNASLLRAFEGLGAAMLERSKKSSFGGRNGEYTASDDYEDSPEDVGATSPLSGQEVDDLDRLANDVVIVLQQNALDNGLPPKHQLARLQSAEDEYIADGYQPRQSQTRFENKTSSRNVEKSYGEWDSWGGNPSSHKPSDVAPAYSYSRRSATPEVVTAMNKDTIGARNGSTTSTSKEDGWSSWQPTSSVNNAFENRANMRRRSSSSSSTRTVPRDNSPKPVRPQANQPTEVSSTSTFTNPIAHTNGWMGSNNVDSVRSRREDGWEAPAQNASATCNRSSRNHDAPVTPSRQPAKVVDVPTRSGLAEEPSTSSAAWTSGWQQYDRYNPRTGPGKKGRVGYVSPNAGFSPSRPMTRTLSAEIEEYPELPSASQGVPFLQKEDGRPTAQATGWGDWKPTRTQDGEEAYKGRQGKGWMAAGLVPSQIKRTDSPGVSVQLSRQQNRANHVPSEHLLASSETERAISSVENTAEAAKSSAPTDSWNSWKPSVAADVQGAQNFERRAAMARGETVPPIQRIDTPNRPQSYQHQVSQPVPRRQQESEPAQTARNNDEGERKKDDTDPWMQYEAKPVVNDAYKRRAAMSSGASASNSFSSTSSTSTPLRTPSQMGPAKTLSIIGRAGRKTEALAAKEARPANGVSDLGKRMGSLNIRGAARAASIPPPESTTSDFASRKYPQQQSASYTTQANGAATDLGSYSIPMRRPQGPTSFRDQPSRGFSNMRSNVFDASSVLSEPASSDSGTFTSKQTVGNTATSAAPSQDHTKGAIPAGGIGWD